MDLFIFEVISGVSYSQASCQNIGNIPQRGWGIGEAVKKSPITVQPR